MGLTQAVVKALSDVDDLQQRRDVPIWRLVQATRGNGRGKTDLEKR
jgi:hypothetical protein